MIGRDAWMFELTSHDDVVRDRALARHQGLVASCSGVTFGSGGDRTIFWYLDALWNAESRYAAVTPELWPFVALYLRWETRFPGQWGSRESNACSPWTVKEVTLGHLGRNGLPAEARPEAADLLVDAIHRPYRCKDWAYPVLVRHVAGAAFRDRLALLSGADDPLVALRARFLLHLADHPEAGVNRKTWRNWLDGRQALS